MPTRPTPPNNPSPLLAEFRQRIQENDALILSPTLDNGRAIVKARTAIYTSIVARWVEAQRLAFDYNRPFAVLSIGGTGREEVTPRSDLDLVFLFEDEFETHPFFLHLQRKTMHSSEFEDEHGFSCGATPLGVNDAPKLKAKQLNAFLDMAPLYDPFEMTERFRLSIRDNFDPFEHFLHLRSMWKAKWEKACGASECLEHFDIKNEGLRLFLGGVWTLGAREFRHSSEIYAQLEDPRDLDAYEFLLRIRSWIHLRKPVSGKSDASGNHVEDVMDFDDFTSFGEMLGAEAGDRERFEFANEVRTRLLSARRRVASFARGIIERELHVGRRIAPGRPIVLGASGLFHDPVAETATPEMRSRAVYSLLLASQFYGLPVDPSELQGTLRGAGDWLVPSPDISTMFEMVQGSLAGSFDLLSQVDGAMERLFPGYASFETSMDQRVNDERLCTRGAMEREKMNVLEDFVARGQERVNAAVSPEAEKRHPLELDASMVVSFLDSDHLVAVKLALKTKRLPLTESDRVAREDASLQWHERYSSGFSGIPLEDYFDGWEKKFGFTTKALEVTRFLIANRRTFKDRVRENPNSDWAVKAFSTHCKNEQQLRALFVFTCADRTKWESEKSDPVRWFNSRELYSKTLAIYRSVDSSDPTDLLRAAGYGGDEITVLRDFGPDLFSGIYRSHAARFGAHLVEISRKQSTGLPKATVLRDGSSIMLGVAARDWRGLAACISGALSREGIELRQAHLFSAMNFGLALDFFHIHFQGKPLPPDLTKTVEEAIREQRHIADADEATLPIIHGKYSLSELRPGHVCLRFESREDTRGMVYALCYKVFRYLQGNIHGLTAYTTKKSVFDSVYLNLPKKMSFADAQRIVAGWGGAEPK